MEKVFAEVCEMMENPPAWPKVGERYIWEMDKPHAVKGVIVTAVEWNGEEWWITTEGLTPANLPDGNKVFNELERFQEACWLYKKLLTIVGLKAQGQVTPFDEIISPLIQKMSSSQRIT